jgi:DHA1 family multidrug resistance protein-like MFS transporter
MLAWQRNLYFIMASQFFSLMGFAFAVPFVPFYLQDMGVHDPHELKIWIALFNFAAPLTLAIFAPIWGALSDRYGRRLMLLRANLGSVIVLAAMGLAGSPAILVLLRLLQGVLTGTVTASQTFVSVHAPKERIGYSLGMLSAAVCSGSTSGIFFGGMFAEVFGYRVAFFAGSGLMLLASLLVLLGTEEYLPKRRERDGEFPRLTLIPRNLGTAKYILPTVTAIGLVMCFDIAWLPLLVQDIHGSLQGASFLTGTIGAVAGFAGFIAGPIIGRLADRIQPPVIAKYSTVGAGLMSVLTAVAWCFPILFASRFCTAFCAGGLDPVFQIWLSKITPEKDRGFVFGWAATARSVGWMFAPLISGMVAWLIGLRAIFLAAAVLFFLLVPLIAYIVRKLARMNIS